MSGFYYVYYHKVYGNKNMSIVAKPEIKRFLNEHQSVGVGGGHQEQQ